MALNSAFPVKENEQDNHQCDCSKPPSSPVTLSVRPARPAGYKDTSPNGLVRSCTQIGCSEGDFEA
ncbi:hypothetical protein CRV24_004609 [Beauveria bassiana]|nr:hypothetical protein CRV24_004609 [Beauveria bassiana]